MEEQPTLTPEIGMPALFQCGSDQYAGTITAMTKGLGRIVFTSETGHENIFTRRRDGHYRLIGVTRGFRLYLNDTSPTRLDPCF